MGAIRRRLADEQGFTLVELLVVTLIIGVVGAVTATGIISGMRTTADAQDRAEAQAATRVALERASRELRMADPLRYATGTEVHLDVALNDEAGVVHFRYAVESSGDRWDLVERRWNLGWDRYQADTQDPDDPPDSERTLIADLSTEEVFAFRDVGGALLTDSDVDDGYERARRAGSAELSIERFVGQDRSSVDVDTHVTIRNR